MTTALADRPVEKLAAARRARTLAAAAVEAQARHLALTGARLGDAIMQDAEPRAVAVLRVELAAAEQAVREGELALAAHGRRLRKLMPGPTEGADPRDDREPLILEARVAQTSPEGGQVGAGELFVAGPVDALARVTSGVARLHLDRGEKPPAWWRLGTS